MKYILPILLLALIVVDVTREGMSLGPGLSLKNAILYVAAMAFTLRLAVQGEFRLTLPQLHAAFGLLIGYAVISLLVLVLVFKTPGYRPIPAVIALKSNLIDHFLFFAVCYYGAQTQAETLGVLRILLAIVAASSIITVGNALGWFAIGAIEIGSNGRVQGAMGEANQHAAFLATMIPPLVAAYVVSRRLLGKCFWMCGIVLSLVALAMTASRGGMLALLVGAIVGTYVFRRYLPVGRIAMAGALCVAVVLVVAFMSGYAQLLYERVIEQTFIATGDMSSGRSEIWETAFSRMMESPWSLVSGFGWFRYETMAFRYLSHNSYLHLWFNLGLVGLFAFIAILLQLWRLARKAVAIAEPAVRANLIGAAVGLIGLAVSIFFVNLFTPWPYIWALLGLNARLAVNELAAVRDRQRAAENKEASKPRRSLQQPARRPGWSAAQGSPIH